ncbi:hypothetical protein F5884DRAFT_680075 [Xylogone sp. PMI_703]|nr:hypothetical protein F5884DRAFT_680075 [Xylogone sp. PMI_703]
MKDSWSHGDDRRERGRVDRGVTRSRRSRSPPSRRHESDREDKQTDREVGKSRASSRHIDRPRDYSPDHRRRVSRSPGRNTREDVRERNRGRELLDTRGSDKHRRDTYHSSSLTKRRKSRSPSPIRSHHKRRYDSRSPSRTEAESRFVPREERKRRSISPGPSRRRSPERRTSELREGRSRTHRESGISDRRGRSPSPRREKYHSSRETSHRHHHHTTSKHDRSPLHSPERSTKPRRSSIDRPRDRERRRSVSARRRSPEVDRYEPSTRSRQSSPRRHRDRRPSRGSSLDREKLDRRYRDEYRPDSNHSHHKSSKRSPSRDNSVEPKSPKMDGRGYYGQSGYNPNPQMQAAFPLKPQYSQGPPIDPRQYSQSPQHITPVSSHQGSPQAHSPYSANRAGWSGQPQHQYSPQPQYPQNYSQPNYSTPGPQNPYYPNQPPTVSYQAPPSGPMHPPYPQSNFRGNQRGYRGNHFNASVGRGAHRGGRGGHFQNLHWNAGGNSGGAGRGQHPHSGNVTPQHVSPPHQFQPPSVHQSPNTVQPSAEEEEDSEDLFRPSKELQVEDTSQKNDEEKMPPPSRPPPTGPQSSKFSFAFKATSKTTPTPPRPEISMKLTAAPVRKDVQLSPDRSRLPTSGRAIPGEPARPRTELDEPPVPATRKVKRIKKRLRPRPELPTEFKTSDSVYFRKPGNESVVGSGTYGKVFKAIHVYTKKLVALKKIRMEGERDGFPVTAVREIKLLQSLKHSNIVNLQEVMVEKNDCFMVFEYLSHDLTGLLNHPSFKLEASHKKHLARQLFEGLAYLHRRGVLHRDIKAANILVSNEGQLKIADFGLARFYSKHKQLDYTNRVITIWYRSPELLLGETQYGPAVDIWSAACVLVEIFTRHAIFPGDGGEISQLEKIYAILGTPNKVDWPGLVDMQWFELLRPTAKRPNVFAEKYKDRVTPAAFELLEAMFQYDPAKRPSASDVLEHPYFTTEEPLPKQAIELQALEGDWHEFESKALRKENERKDKEARKQAQREAAAKEREKDRERKRAVEGDPSEDRNAKRLQLEASKPSTSKLATENEPE